MKKLKSSSFKGVFIASSNEVLFSNQKRYFDFKYKACKEIFVTMSIVMYFRKNFFLTQAINHVISNLESGGLIEHWHFNYIDKKFSQTDKNQNDAKQITVEHLLGCFQLWGVGCLIAFTCFIIEIIRFSF